MENQNEKAISTLNTLIEYCKDGQYGYKTAAENVKTENLKSIFSDLSAQRGQFVEELKGAVRVLGGDPDKDGSIVGTIHRGWINLKGTLSGGDEEAILKEC